MKMADVERKASSRVRISSSTEYTMDGHEIDDRNKNGDVEEEDVEIPDFNDPPNYVDRVSDEDLLGDFLRSKPKETDGTDSVIIVDNVPQVGPERLEKLQNIIRKMYSKFGTILNERYPTDNGTTKGYIFLEFQNSLEAIEAVKSTHGYKLDKQHTFAVNLLSDFDKYKNIPEVWEPPKPQEYKDHGNLYSYVMNPHAYNQFSVMFEGGERTGIYSHTPGEPTELDVRDRWTETYIKWSPRGTYLATFHQKGIALWGGDNMKQIVRFLHPGVQLIDFSPCEKYAITFSPMPDESADDPQAIIIWDLRTGHKKRGFHCERNVSNAWPIFKWSADGKYFARMTGDSSLSIYETPSFGLLEKKSIKIKNLRDFAWSPTDSIVSYWTSEERDAPARVTLIEIPSRTVLCVKNLFTVADCKMHWQNSGDYLCVKVDRYKSKKEEKDSTVKYGGIYHNFNIFRIREKEIPVDTVEVKESISVFAWEPVGHRFAFIHGETPRIGVTFYYVRRAGTIEHIKTLEKRSVNNLYWSPNGQFIVLAGLRSMNGVLEFVDTGDLSATVTAEHFMATDVEWDPSGRYVMTAVSWWGHKVDNAYWIWSFQGKLLSKHTVDKFCSFNWRPRPPSLLSADQIKEIKKNMKKYNAMFSVEDKMRESKASKEQIERRRSQMEAYDAWVAACVRRYQDFKPKRLELRDKMDTDEIERSSRLADETIEFLVEVKETIVEE